MIREEIRKQEEQKKMDAKRNLANAIDEMAHDQLDESSITKVKIILEAEATYHHMMFAHCKEES